MVDHDLRAQVAALERRVQHLRRERSASEIDALASAQHRADSVGAMFGDRASAPVPGEAVSDYRKRLLKHLARYSPKFRQSRFDALEGSTLSAVEDQVFADALSSARTTAEASPAILIPYEERDPAGRVITKYHGDWNAAFGAFQPASKQIVTINRPGWK
jgi:colicin import membrane protein